MITGIIRNKIDKIWTDIWAGGITNPLTVIEQLTYLMFIRSLDEKELETEELEALSGEALPRIFPKTPAGQSMRWSRFKNNDPRDIYQVISRRVFPAVKEMKYGRLPDFNPHTGELIPIPDDPKAQEAGNETAFSRYMSDAMFLIPTPQVLQKIITGLDDLYEHDLTGLDMQGDLYEYMLGKLATAGQNGQFRTPKHIREMMVALLQPTPDDTICDPACGTAGFLVSAAEYIRKNYENTMTPEQWEHFAGDAFTGFDTDRTMLRISAMNLMLHSISHPEIDYKDSLSKQNEITGRFTLCLANPPFKGTVDAESINDNLKAVTNTKKTELLFLALFLRLLKKGGRCACIVPDGVLFGSSRAHQDIRRELVENHQLRAVISMPSGVFKPYAGVSTAVLVFTKTGAGGTDNVWFYDMKADGFSLDDKRSETAENDIPDIISRFHNPDNEASRKRTEQSFFVPKEEIVGNGYDLSINKYKKTDYVPVEYPPTSHIMAELHTLEEGNHRRTERTGGDAVMARFADILSDETKRGYKIQTGEYLPFGKYPIIDQGQSQIAGYTNLENGLFKDIPTIIFGDHTRIVKYVDTPFFLGADGVKILKTKVNDADYKYLFYCLQNAKIPNTGYNRHFKWLKEIEIPLPPLEEQRKIVAVLDKVSDLIAKRRTQLDKLDGLVKSRFIEMFGMPGTDAFGWGMDRLGNACYINPKKGQDTRLVKGLDVSFVPMPAVTEHGEIDASARKKYEEVKTGFTYFAEHDVLFAKITPCMENGKGAIARNLCNGIGFGSTEFHVLRPIQEKTNPHWIYTLTSFSQFREDAANNMTGSAGQRRVPVSFLENYLVSVPPLDLQNRFTTFVAQTDKSKYFGMNGIKLLWKLNDIFLGAICE